MNDMRDFDRAVDRWLDDGSDATPPEVIDAVLLAARSTPQERDFRLSWRPSPMKRFAYAAAAVAVLAVSVTALSSVGPRLGIGRDPIPEESSTNLGIFEPVAGRIVYGDRDGIWGIDPAAPPDPETRVQLPSEAGTPLAWSGDGTRLLVMRQSRGETVGAGAMPAWHLFVLHADGSERQVTERPMADLSATISPDGSRVVFAGATETAEGECCAFALYAVDADGGPAEMLREGNGVVVEPTFSPDGTRIAYADGAGDHSNSVWLMDADGSDAHQIVSNEWTAEAGHVRALAWSPAGDRIALGLEGTIYTFATDGSGFTSVLSPGERPYWSPDGSQLAYTISCGEDPDGCLAIADADGSNVLRLGFGASGPWHPGTLDALSVQAEGDAVFEVALHYYTTVGRVTRVPEPTRIHAQLPDGWESTETAITDEPEGREAPISVSFWTVDAVFTDPCGSCRKIRSSHDAWAGNRCRQFRSDGASRRRRSGLRR